MEVEELTVKDALTSASETSLTFVNPVPVSVTEVPTRPLPGEKAVIESPLVVTVKTFSETAVPPGVVTRHLPVLAPLGTVAVIEVAELTVKVALMSANETSVAPVNPVPVNVTVLPAGPLDGENDAIVGASAERATAPPNAADAANATATSAAALYRRRRPITRSLSARLLSSLTRLPRSRRFPILD